jgi:16S rRNA G966 N2-methylase RsmD
MLKDPGGQVHMFEKSLEEELEPSSATAKGPVECLGMTFPNDEERRKHFLEKLREKLQDPEFRRIEGFPIGSDEDILALSDPPYYTACPNPFIADFIKHYGKPYDPETDDYRREPFVADVSEGKKHPLYTAHSYHTKVPHRAIMRYLQHYTAEGDLVLDFFAGSGMTGLATLLFDGRTPECKAVGIDSPHHLSGLLSELSPAATFIASQYIKPLPDDIQRVAKRVVREVEESWGWLYQTQHPHQGLRSASYYVWSDVFICPDCAETFDFYSAAVDRQEGSIHSKFKCPHCQAELNKRQLTKSSTTRYDSVLAKTIKWPQAELVLVSTEGGKDAFEFAPTSFDRELVTRIEENTPPFWLPANEFPKQDRYRRDALESKGVSHAHHFYTWRNLLALGALYERLSQLDLAHRSALLHAFTGILLGVSRLQRYRPESGFPNMVMSGTLYIGSLVREWNVFQWFLGKVKSLDAANRHKNGIDRRKCLITTQSSATLVNAINAIDYIFVDPPFGGNLQYSELNFMYESWLRVFTPWRHDAVVNKPQGKDVLDYARIMERCFRSAYLAMKPGRWMTVEFHNSAASIWNAIQENLAAAGFVIADVRIIDKQQNTFKQTNNPGSVKQDLAITAYKPNGGLEDRFKLEAGTEEGVWDFVRMHLKQLPVFVSKDGQAEVIAERQSYLLFDRMVAFHVQRGVTVPLSAAELYAGLEQRFSERDGMYFLPDQVAGYDRKRMTVREVLQLQLFVTDESSAIQWLNQQLTRKPQTFQELHPQFLKEIGGWQKHEEPLELSEMLQQSFLRYDGKGEVPSQIHSYLSTNFKELRNLPKDDPDLRAKGKDRWYVPDPNKAGDLERLRERSLLREFEEYRGSKQRRLTVFRVEAVRAGFKKAWQERDYANIIAVARKIPENVLQEDPKLLMWYDQAITRSGEDA